MKKFILVFALAVVVGLHSSTAKAMSESGDTHSTVAFGIHGGLSVANGSVSGAGASGSVAGFSVGVALEMPFMPGFLYFQPELNFVQRGGENTAFGSLASTRLNNLEIPLLAKLKVNVGPLRPYVVAGPRFGYLLNANTSGIDRTASFNRIDLGADLGGGMGFQFINGVELLADVRYSLGFVDIDSAPSDWKTQGVMLRAGMLF